MKFHKSELIFLGYLMLLALGGFIAYWTSSSLSELSTNSQSSQVMSTLDSVKLYITAILAIFGISIVVGLAAIYPTIRTAVKEKGRLSLETQTLARKTESFQHAALTDPLTGLQNRRYFDDALDQYLQEFSSIGHPLGMIVMDLDHFKKVNDTYGHDVGDDVLRGVTKCLLDYTRFHDVVARIGGEEFAILAPNLDMAALNRLAERICFAVSEITFQADNVSFRVTTSMGLAMWDGSEDGNTFYKRADKNLYRAKQGGRNQAVA